MASVDTKSTSKAELLRELHHSGWPLVLVNAWDAVSARIVEELGFSAVATTSAGVAWTEGFPDGEKIPRAHMLARVKQIAAAVALPVTADLEGGYGSTVDDAVATARGAIEAGAVGLNFEDAEADRAALLDAKLQCDRIAAMRNLPSEREVPIVINARTDVYLREIGEDNRWRLEESIRRGNLYLESGADCIFVPGPSDEETISILASHIKGPINVLANAKTPSVERLRELGIARISVGSGGMGYVLARFREAAAKIRDDGTFHILSHRMPHAEVNSLFEL